MTDSIDQAQALQQQHIDAALAAVKKQVTKLKTGQCNYCAEITDGVFCDDDCRDDYEREQQIKARQRGERR